MRDIVLDQGPGIPHGLVLPASEFTERFARASGPGGQGVNTTDSRVQLSFDIATSTTLTDQQKARLLTHLGPRLAATTLTVDASEQRSQHLNRIAARTRMAALLRDALAPPPPPRRPTRRTRSSVERRLNAKRLRSLKKASRRLRDD